MRELPANPAFGLDMNNDGVFTISDVSAWFAAIEPWALWLVFLPGDFLLGWAMTTPVGTYFEMTPEWYGGWYSGIISGLAWLLLVVSVLAIAGNVDERWVNRRRLTER